MSNGKKNLYSIDVGITATAYIRADSAKEALEIANRELSGGSLELSPQETAEIPISGRMFNDPKLPDVSLSPAMTIHGPGTVSQSRAFLVEKGQDNG